MQVWSAAVGAWKACITPGSPWENGYCESVKAKVCDELINGEISYSAGGYERLAAALQHHSSKRLARIPPTGTQGRRDERARLRSTDRLKPARSP